jgi:CubicO group peptidase (beta-lactamase class C family)
VIAVIVLAGGLYGLAYLTTSRSGLSRSIIWMDADVFDYRRFPARSMEASDDPLVLNRASPDRSLFDAAMPGGELESFLAQTQTAAFIAIRDDEVIYEDYFNGYDEDSTVTSFSVAKSYVATLIGIALEEGFIDTLDDPVTRYIPELLERDQRFHRITLRHLLTMSSGLRWNEQGLPWSDDTETYYGTNLRRLAMEDTEIVAPPGESFVYNPYNTLLLGIVLERATEQQVSGFMENELWRPMGAVADGTWSLDSDTKGFEKMESGLNSRAIDMVKLGLVYLHGGALNR